MVLEYLFKYKSSSLVYEKILLKELRESILKCALIKEDSLLKFYVESDDSDLLLEFSNSLSLLLPHSIFLHDTAVYVVEEMPESNYELESRKKPSLGFCPSCLKKVMDEDSVDYYNVFCECEACGYSSDGKQKSYKKELQHNAKLISDGLVIKINTFYGEYFVGKLDSRCNDISYDIISYDLPSIQNYTNVTNNEVVALGAIEKPLIKLKTNLKFKMDFENIEDELIRFKLADDFILYLLMQELNKLGVNLAFISKDEQKSSAELLIVDSMARIEPIECVVGKTNIAILGGTKGLPTFEMTSEKVIPFIGAFNSVIKEHKLINKTIVGLNLSREYHNNILIYSKKFGLIEYLSFKFELYSISEIFEAISSSDERGEKLLNSYKSEFKDIYEDISKISFNKEELNIHKLWGIIAVILGYSNDKNLYTSANILEDNAKSFLGAKGPRIDYKIKNIDSKVYLDPLMVIRTAMTFRLAGIDKLSLCYGVIESFVEFLAGILDDVKHDMKSDGVAITGSLLENRHLFSKLDEEIVINHKLYFNNELPVDGINIRYGGNELLNS